MKRRNPEGLRSGFTIIEVIITLLVAAIMGSMLVSYMSGGIMRSSQPLVMVKREFNIYETLEKITADYQNDVPSNMAELATFASNIASTYNTGDMTLSSDYIDIARVGGGTTVVGTPTTTTGLILRVTLQQGDQSVVAYFTR